MKYDKPLLAFLLGALATIPYEIFTLILVALGFGKYSTYELSSLIVTVNRPAPVLGFVASCLVGGFTAFLLYYALKPLGWDYLLYKSLVAGLFSWVITEAIFVWLIEGPKLIPYRPVSDYSMHLIGSVIYGVVLGVLFKKYLLGEHLTV